MPTPTAPVRDVVIDHATQAEARATATASAQRYPVNDGAGRSVAISVSTLCDPLISCQNADPQTIADFLGTLAHGDEMNLLSVDIEPSSQLATTCGSGDAQACYFPGQNMMVINGNDTTTPPPDNASREYVIAHEYGHHLANHRDNSPFGNPAIDWGPKNWASWAGVCQGVKAGGYFPGDEGNHYFDNPGEAFAESFAHNRFPDGPVPWEWPDFPDPHSGAFPAIEQDALHPWTGDVVEQRRGRFPKKKKPGKIVKRFDTPLDGDLTLTLKGPDRARLGLKLKDASGHTLARSNGPGSHEQINYTICGQRGLSAVVQRHGRQGARFKLTVVLP